MTDADDIPTQPPSRDPAATHIVGGPGPAPGTVPNKPPLTTNTSSYPPRASSPTPAAPASPTSHPSKRFGGRFEVISEIGHGGMGTVYKVRDLQIEDRQVALKVLHSQFSNDPRFREMFFREIRTAQGFVSEHVIQVRDCGQLDDGQLFVTMDFVDGEDAGELLKREQTLSSRHALEITRQVLLGLASGHEQGFVHRDVKPQNVMLSARTPKTESNPFGVQAGLLDFGIAGLIEELDGQSTAGTPYYMSPEQINGQRLDPRSDLFSVGVMLYELLVGKRPFEGRTIAEITTSVLETDLVPLIAQVEGVKKPVKRLLRKALQKERDKRFQSAAEFVQAIEKSSAFQPAEGAPSWVAAAATGLALSTAALGVLYFDARQSNRTRGQAETGLSRDYEQLALTNDALREENDAKRAEITRIQSEVKSLTASLNETEAKLSNVQTEANQRNLETESKRTDAFSDREEIKTERDKLVAVLNSVIIDTATIRSAKEPRVAAARAFDEVLDEIESGTEAIAFAQLKPDSLPRGVYDALESLQDVASALRSADESDPGNERIGTLSRANIGLKRILRPDWTATLIRNADKNGRSPWLGLREYDTSEIAEFITKQVYEASQLLSSTDDSWQLPDDFRTRISITETERALYEHLWDDATRTERIDRLRETLDEFRMRLDNIHEEVTAHAAQEASTEDWSGPAAPALAVQFLSDYGSFGWVHAPEILERLLNAAEERIVDGDQRLVADALDSDGRTIARLAEIIRAASSDELDTEIVAEDIRMRLEWLAAAWTWYASGEAISSGHWIHAALDQPLSAEAPTWQQSLRLRFQIAQEYGSVNFPMNPSSLAVYEIRDLGSTAGTRAGWESTRNISTEGNASTERATRLSPNGKSTGKVRDSTIRRHADALIEVCGQRVDLRRLDASWYLGVEGWLPNETSMADLDRLGEGGAPQLKQLWGTRLQTLVEENRAEPDGTLRCLKLHADIFTLWIHPVLGIVRKDTANRSRDLAHLQR